MRSWGEFHGRQHIVIGAFLGLLGSASSLVFYSFGVFIAEFSNSFGWSRGTMSASLSIYAAVFFLGSTFSGRLADRVGAGLVAAVSTALLGLCLMLIPLFLHDISSMWLVYGAASIAGLGTSPVVILKPVVVAFSVNRGLAIALSVMGLGFGSIIIPLFAALLVSWGGWQLGYIGLGCLALVIAPAIWLTLVRGKIPAVAVGHDEKVMQAGSLRDVLGTKQFWMLALLALFVTIAVGGLIPHLIPYLIDGGLNATEAAGYASLFGMASLAGRIVSGLLLDRIEGPIAGLLFMLSGVLGLILLATIGTEYSFLGVILCGFALGSEVDLLAYYTSRYFPLRMHATIFGWNYSMISLATICGPLTIGMLRDFQGSYVPALLIMTGVMIAAALLCLSLGRYKYDIAS